MRIEIRTGFDEEVMASELPIRKAVAKTVKMLQGMENISSLINHLGLNFEKLHGFIDPETGEQLYSIRITKSARALTCLLNVPTIVLVSLLLYRYRFAHMDKHVLRRNSGNTHHIFTPSPGAGAAWDVLSYHHSVLIIRGINQRVFWPKDSYCRYPKA
mgnify:CR=1 FL=1